MYVRAYNEIFILKFGHCEQIFLGSYWQKTGVRLTAVKSIN